MSELSDRIAERSLSLIPDVQPSCPLRLKGVPPLIEKLWRSALREIEQNDCIETPYGVIYSAGDAGRHFTARVFNRDVGYSGILGLNAVYPDRMLSSMKIIRRIRLEMGWNCPKDRVISGVPGATVENLTNHEFMLKYLKASPINKTDDVLWLWCMDELLDVLGNPRSEWEWLYENGKRSFQELYAPFLDESDGLYFGQPSFIDVGGTGYPTEFGPFREMDTCNRGVWVKASSTNSLYYKGLCVMAKAARKLDCEKAAEGWEIRAEKLRQAMLQKLRFSDGTFTYFLHPDGHAEPRREVLGTAFPVLLDVARAEDAKRAVAGYPFTPLGAPLLCPFFDRDDFYHNNSAWPFASTFLSWAMEKATGMSHAAENLEMLINAVKNGKLYEVFDLRRSEPAGCAAQLWTDASLINVCARMGWIDLPSLHYVPNHAEA